MSWSASREAQSSCVWSGQHKHLRSRLLESPTRAPQSSWRFTPCIGRTPRSGKYTAACHRCSAGNSNSRLRGARAASVHLRWAESRLEH